MICLYSSGINRMYHDLPIQLRYLEDVPCFACTVAVLIGCAMFCLYSRGINRMCHDLPIQLRY